VFGPLEAILLALRSEARLKAWTGSLDEARKALHQGQASALSTHQPRLYFTLAAEEVDLQLRFGDIASAMDTLRRTNLLDTDNSLISADTKANIAELTRLTQAKLFIAENKSSEALRLLNLIYKSAYSNQRTIMLQQVRALKSIALWKSGRESEAVRELDKALSVAAPEGQAYPIISAGACILDILEAIRDKRGSAYIDEAHREKQDFEHKLIALLRGENPAQSSASPAQNEIQELADPLTDREIEILKLIGAGLGNKQLADELLISISTVKWHLHNVYEKVGVRSRTAAAAVARNMNLLLHRQAHRWHQRPRRFV
jgi:LuxR family maltose regulon positive regulatory protein